MPEDKVRELVAQYTKGRTLGFIGESRVNVPLLNLASTRLGLMAEPFAQLPANDRTGKAIAGSSDMACVHKADALPDVREERW